MTKPIHFIKFDPYDSALEQGINLIEASAGTGKTFSIVMLVLRFILQNGYSIDQLLVVTFTNAAAQELRDRIRSRLLEVKSVFSGKPTTDSLFNDWVADLPEQQARDCLATALADIDNANIFTIHGFCQRILSQYALETGQVFGSELLQSTSQIKQQIAEDYWRLQTYGRSIPQVILLRKCATTPYSLLNSIEGIREGSDLIPETETLDTCLDAAERTITDLKLPVATVLASINTAIAEQADKFKPAFVTRFHDIKEVLQNWIESKQNSNTLFPLDEILSLSTQQVSSVALNGVKFRKTKTLTGEQRKTDFLNEFEINPQHIDVLEQHLSTMKIAFQQGLHRYLHIELENRLTQSNQLSFDGMIKRLSEALQREDIAPNTNEESTNEKTTSKFNTPYLKQLLREKFPVALIDEFQDTDDAQWSIFSSLVESNSKGSQNSQQSQQKQTNYLYLIGDPKQAIYKFRGADIYSYLAAHQQAHRHYSLALNWRSQQPLVQAVNTLFAIDKPFLIEQIAYHPVDAALQETVFTEDDNSLEKLVLWELDKNPEQKDGYWVTGKGKPKDQIRTHVVKEILSLLEVNKQANTILEGSALCPSDIAILVRSNPEAAAYQQALVQYGVPSVLNSKTSVFASQQAIEIYHLLHAISRPGNQQLVRYALCQPWFGLSGNDLYDLLEQPQQIDDWLIRFHQYHELWEHKGLLTMMQQLMEEEDVVQHLATVKSVERSLANINHILELLQEVAVSKRLSMIKTLEWLEDAIQERVIQDGQELRLESDENAINIVTIHSSKGLEYPIVFCPDLWSKRVTNHSKVVALHKNGRQISDLGSEQLQLHRELSQQEDQAEEMRLLYVAITRAKYRCYVAWADQRTLKEENHSALAYLYKQQKGESWTDRMATLVSKQQGVDYQLLAVNPEIEGMYTQSQTGILLTNRQLQRKIKTDWMMSSYSALAYYSVHDSDIPEIPLDKSQEQERMFEKGNPDGAADGSINTAMDLDSIQTLPKGAHTGNLVHELLEHTSFTILSGLLTKQFTEQKNNTDYTNKRTEMIKRFAVDIENTDVLDRLLMNTVATALSAHDNNFTLMNLQESQCLKEMPFYFAVKQLDTLKINTILAHSASYLPLSAQQMHGQLTGFIDLICEYQGQYYVMDYKTNSLSDYSTTSMTESMREHNYGLQYWIYSLVLHRYLQQTLEDYSFEKHFGGVRYLFVRGMQPDEPMSGVFQDQPDLQTIEALSEVFSS